MKDNQAKYPQLRFKGFTDAWVQRNLSELLQERNHQIEPNDEYELMSFVAGTGVTPKGERYDRSALVTNDSKKYKVTEFGDFIYSSNNLETGSIGFNKTGKAVISPVYSIFYSTENADSRFIGLLSSQKNFIHSMVRYRQGVVYGQWRIHESDFLKIAVFTPKLDEQNKIIEFFERFDKLIAANQRKLDLLKEQKKGYLQKMFPKNGAKVPELRFAGFADAWEERKLGNLFSVTDTKHATAPTTDKETQFRMIRTSYVRDGRLLVDQTESVTEQTYKQWSERIRLQPGDIVFSREAPIGEVAIIPDNSYHFFLGQRMVALRSTTEVSTDAQFTLATLLAPRFRREVRIRDAASNTVANFGIPDIKKTSIYVPTPTEQNKLGTLIMMISDTIALHQRKLEKLQELKKGYLQKMFC